MPEKNKSSPLLQLLARSNTPPFSHNLPSKESWSSKKASWPGKLNKNFKLLKRWAGLNISLQSRLLRDRLPPSPAKLLWIHYSSCSIGDSIMELAGRMMLGDYHVDLLTNKQYAELYFRDKFFEKVFTQPAEINSSKYDFVILDIINTRSLKQKRLLCPKLPFASLQEFYYGRKYNRMLFSCYRIHHLLGYPHNDIKLREYLRPRLFVEDMASILPLKRKSIQWTLLLGGEKAFKTYQRWPEVIKILHSHWPTGRHFPKFILVGSKSGLAYLNPILTALHDSKVVSHVGHLTLRETARVIFDSDFFLGTDGGLMHCAVALSVPGLAIFGKVDPLFFLPPSSSMSSVFDEYDVNNVPPKIVVEAIMNHPNVFG